MEQNLPVQEQSFESDSEPEEEARDTALLINGQDSKENLENDLILEPQKLSETEQNDTGEPVAKNPKLSEDLLPLRKTAKALSSKSLMKFPKTTS